MLDTNRNYPDSNNCGGAALVLTLVSNIASFLLSPILSIVFAPFVFIGVALPKFMYRDFFVGQIIKGFTAWSFMYTYGTGFPYWV